MASSTTYGDTYASTSTRLSCLCLPSDLSRLGSFNEELGLFVWFLGEFKNTESYQTKFCRLGT